MKTFIATIIGKPNVGKSTLINNLFKRHVSIVSSKPQTTRNNIKALYEEKDFQLIIIDTPGYHKPKNKLDMYLNSQVRQSFKEADGYLFIFDASRPINTEDFELFEKMNTFPKKEVFYILNKVDLVSKEEKEERIKEIKSNFNITDLIEISALNQNDIQKLIDIIKEHSHEFEGELVADDYEADDKFIVSEIIREQILLKFRQEVPHSVAVVTETMKYEPEQNLLKIYSVIVVEKESQKPIIIGKGGKAIKEIGIASRTKLLEIFDTKIYLELNVKVKKNWRDNNDIIASLGYKK